MEFNTMEHTPSGMGRTTIQVSDELADELYSRKQRGESYEDVIWRLIEKVDESQGSGTRSSDREPRGSDVETQVKTSDSVGVTDEPAASPEQELVEQLRSWLENHPPNKPHAQEAVVETFRWLRQHGSGATSEIQNAVYEEVNGDHYSSARTLWNSIDRYLEDVPGIEKAGYGEWKYAGDGATRTELET